MSDKTLARLIEPYSTVIITGGSSGIGKALFTILSRLKPNLLICNLSRTKPAEIGDHRVHIRCDLSCREQTDTAVAEVLKLLDQQQEKGKVLLINNSGCGLYGASKELTGVEQLQMLELNVVAMVHLTSRLLPLLLQRQGAVVNVASTAAFQPTPFLAAYGASKAFVLNWSMALSYELQKEGVQVLTLCPGPTESQFFVRAGFAKSPVSARFGATAEQVAQACLGALAKKRHLVVCGWLNYLMTLAIKLLPLSVLTTISGQAMRHFRSTSAKSSE